MFAAFTGLLNVCDCFSILFEILRIVDSHPFTWSATPYNNAGDPASLPRFVCKRLDEVIVVANLL